MRAYLLWFTLALAGCNTVVPTRDSVLLGQFVEGFEVSEFRTCSGDVYWVINASAVRDTAAQAYELGRMTRVVGALSPEGEWGHLGLYKRQIEVKAAEIADAEDECN